MKTKLRVVVFSYFLLICTAFSSEEPAVLTVRNPLELMQKCGAYAAAVNPSLGTLVQAMIGSVLMNPQNGAFQVDHPVSFYFVPNGNTSPQTPYDMALVWTGKDGVNQSSVSGPKNSPRLKPEPLGDGRYVLAPSEQCALAVRRALSREHPVSGEITFRIPSKECLAGIIGTLDAENAMLADFKSMELTLAFPKPDCLTVLGTIRYVPGKAPQLPAATAKLHCLRAAHMIAEIRAIPGLNKIASADDVLPVDRDLAEMLETVLSQCVVSDSSAATLISFRLPAKEKQKMTELLNKQGQCLKQDLYQLDKHVFASLSDGCLDILITKRPGKKSKEPSGIQDVECSWKAREFLTIQAKGTGGLEKIGSGFLQEDSSRLELKIPAVLLMPLIPPELLVQTPQQ